ncbi:MAG: DNA recombination protein RmuC [Candidatus Omnitrophota bacterium]
MINTTFLISILILAIIIIIILLFYKKNANFDQQFQTIEKMQGRVESTVKEEISRNRDELIVSNRELREEIGNILKSFEQALFSRISETEKSQKNLLDTFTNQLLILTQMNEQKLNDMRGTIEKRLEFLQKENSLRLEEMRGVVDEKLQTTLEKRLGESFKVVSDQLESVYRGLGQMQALALSVGDLKKVLTNVKDRGTWGEIQLGMLLEQILTPDQYAANVTTNKGSNTRVEFAIKLPGPSGDLNAPVWLPIDAKFPQEDYQRLIDAREALNSELADKMEKQMERQIRLRAKEITDKYLDPPNTTDFAIMYLPTEGLYAEVSRNSVLIQQLQREFRIVISGPNNLAAFLNSLQMGFKTLAIQKRSSEIWHILGTVKNEFARFGVILEKTKKKIKEAGDTIEEASSKTRNIQRKLKGVQEFPSSGEPGSIEDLPLNDQNDLSGEDDQ